ncbi:SRPBCC domain-containing protein [Marinobacterium arenosum]|uniref:SRPBCC domain-containing protein n=1 Tax=Marinobacterium arenosum TaxID=2862496 RepID=UPI001C983E6E|nr:SRPBCC domain-containing protein [Marinobacterium arenosum]MBY4678579.1 SRPBCC domain-containing protein [Marinobacterium arenosum]
MSDATYELSVSRYIAAAPEKVWQIMTERLPEWWCPTPWKTEVEALEWRAGGRFNTIMRGPQENEEVSLQGVILEFTSGKRFVFTDAFNNQWTPQGPFMIGLFEIEAEGDGTRYRASARHWSEEAMEQHRGMGFEEGWSTVAQQLATLAESSPLNR